MFIGGKIYFETGTNFMVAVQQSSQKTKTQTHAGVDLF